jgi:hypothetical protein
MSPKKYVLKVQNESSQGQRPSRLSESQIRTISALRKLGEKNRTKLLELLKVAKVPPQKDKEPKEPAAKPPGPRAKVKVPVTMDNDAKQILRGLKKAGTKEVVLKLGGKAQKGSFGVHLEKKGQRLKAKLRYSVTPAILRAPFLKNQGDLEYRRLLAQGNTRSINDADAEGRTSDSERTDAKKSTDAANNPDINNSATNGNADNEANNAFSQGIQDLVNGMLEPKQFDLLGSGSIRLDNVAWHDFSEYIYTLDPYQSDHLMKLIYSPTVEVVTAAEKESSHAGDIIGAKGLAYLDAEAIDDLVVAGVDPEGISWIQRFHIELTKAFQDDIQLSWTLGFDPSVCCGQSIADYEQIADDIVSVLFGSGMEDVLASLSELYGSIAAPSARKSFLISLINTFTSELSLATTRTDYPKVCNVYTRIHKGTLTTSEIAVAWMAVNEEARITWFEEPEAVIEFPLPQPYQFSPFPAYTYNLGLRLVYRQEWRPLGIQRGETVRTIPLGPKQVEKVSTKIIRRKKVATTSENLKSIETTTESSETTKDSSEIVNEAMESFKWNVEAEASGGIAGIFSAGLSTEIGEESENKSQSTTSHLTDTMQKMASKQRSETKVVVSTEAETTFEETRASEIQNPNEEIPITYVYSKLQRQYEILTSLAEVINVVMVAEPLPAPEEIDFEWVSRHDWIIAKVLLDDSFRDGLTSISQEAADVSTSELVTDLKTTMDTSVGHLGALSGAANLSLSDIDVAQEAQRGYREVVKEEAARSKQRFILERKRYRLYEHIRENVLHYMRAIWSQEDPQERLLRYRKRNIMVPLEWNPVGTIVDSVMEVSGWEPAAGGKEVDVADLINPAGPIGYHGNYAIFYMRPEYASESMFVMLHELKNPYLYPDLDELEPGQKRELMDPVLQRHKGESAGNSPTDDDKKEMIYMVPDLRLKAQELRDENPEASDEDIISSIEAEDAGIFDEYYAEYLFREEQSRRFLVETNSLMIDILPGTGSALENFKLAHRGIDVVKAVEEKERMRWENERRKKLVSKGKLGDPDIEKVILVSDSNQLASLVAGVDVGGSSDESAGGGE